MSGREWEIFFPKILGAELRAARERQDWSRPDLVRRVPFVTTQNTIATWEYGTRSIPLLCLVQVCDVLGEPAEDVLARVRARVTVCADSADLGPDGLHLDLTAAADHTGKRSRLSPIRAWAQCRLRDQPDAHPVVPLDTKAVALLAQICEMTTVDLTGRLTSAGLLAQSHASDEGAECQPTAKRL